MKCLLIVTISLLSLSFCIAQEYHWELNEQLLNPYNIHTTGYNTPFAGDFDADGDNDLIVGSQGGVLQYYENIGSPDTAIWQMDDECFEGIDLPTEYAPQPSLVDLDADGMDELYLTFKDAQWGNPSGTLERYINTGSQENPVWEQEGFDIGYDINGLFTHQFIDFDNDNDLDLIFSGNYSQTDRIIEYFRNIGDQYNPAFQIDTTIFTGIETQWGEYIIGRLVNLVNDERLEFIMGESMYDLDLTEFWIFTNEGTPENPVWVHYNSIVLYGSFYSDLTFADLNNDNDLDVLLGNYHLPLYFNENIGTPESAVFESIFNGKPLGELYVGWGNNFCFTDFDNDSDFDLVSFCFFDTYWQPYYDWRSYSNYGTSQTPYFDNSGSFTAESPHWYDNNHYVSAGDLNGDSLPELGLYDGGISYLINSLDEGYTWSNRALFNLNDSSAYIQPELADFDNDGLNDLLVLNNTEQYWEIFKNIGTSSEPQWELRPEWTTGLCNDYIRIRAANINRDQYIDLVGLVYPFHLTGFINNGSGDNVSFMIDHTIFEDEQDYYIRYFDCVDIDGDYDDDVLFNSSDEIKMIENMVMISVSGSPTILPSSTTLLQNYPNPFNAITVISYTLPYQSNVSLNIYDILGRKVETLVDGEQPAGYNQIIWNADGLSSGMYFYKLTAGECTETKKMVLLK